MKTENFLYVAMTRAKNALILTRSEGQSSFAYSYGDAAEAYFLSDVPDKLVEERWQYEMYLDDDDDFLM